MSRLKQSYEKDTNTLINLLTGFEDSDENFPVCVEYAKSNIKFHKFLDPDSHKIHREIDGLCEKFEVHSKKEKSVSLKSLVEEFLEKPSFEYGEKGKTDTHYAILSLLLCLSDAPTHSDYEETAPARVEASGVQFDWAAYLKEGIHVDMGPWPSSPEWSDDDLEEDVVKDKHLTFGEVTTVDDDVTNDLYTTCQSELSSELNSSDWLTRNVVVQYWTNRAPAPNDESLHRTSNLNVDWETYLANTSDIYVPADKMLVTEHQIIRETLWMLCGVESSVVYCWDGAEYRPNTNTRVTHLTQDCLFELLSDFAHYGSIVRHLHEFVTSVTQASPVPQSPGAGPQCRRAGLTYQAFAAAVATYLTDTQKELVELEREICQQDSSHTLTTLQRALSPRFSELMALGHVYTAGIRRYDNVHNPSQQATGLLSALYEALLEAHDLGDGDSLKVHLLFPLWLRTCRPYLDIIDRWLTQGDLVDLHHEFIIQRNLDIKSLDENFWDTAFTLQCSKPDVGNPSGNTTGNPVEDAAPPFLSPVLEHIILAGKSVELIQNLGKLNQVVGDGQSGSLYEIFIQSLETTLGSTEVSANDAMNRSSKSPIAPSQRPHTTFTDNISQQMALRGVKDPLLSLNFAEVFSGERLQYQPLGETEERNRRRLGLLDLSSPTPLQLLLERCLYPHIRQRYENVSAILLRILRDDYHLNDYFTAMRRYYLMEEGDLMYDFYTEILEKLRLHEPWQDVSFLNSTMQESLQRRHPEDSDRMFVTVETRSDKEGRNKHPVTALEGLTLHYQVPWPLDIILHSRYLKVYGLVFSFILQIKRVKYCLDELRFSDLERDDVLSTSADLEERILGRQAAVAARRRGRIHRVHVVRMKLMHFVNSLHNYIMTRILHSTGLEFTADLSTARDMDQIIRAHARYVSRLHERCLLHHKVALLKDVVMKVHDLALTLAEKWDQGVDTISDTFLGGLESEFARCLLFLSSFLTNITKRGSFPHLESLAFALVSTNEAAKMKSTS